jgi:hypothetical protein
MNNNNKQQKQLDQKLVFDSHRCSQVGGDIPKRQPPVVNFEKYIEIRF